MKLTVQLVGRFREFDAAPEITLDLPGIATVADFRAAFDAWAGAHWPGYAPGLLKASAIATASTLLRADSPLPADGRLAGLASACDTGRSTFSGRLPQPASTAASSSSSGSHASQRGVACGRANGAGWNMAAAR